MAVEGVAENSFFPVEDRAEVPEEGVCIPLHLVEQLRKILPSDKRAVMQQAAVTECERDRIEMTTISKTEMRRVAGRPLSTRFPKWREIFSEARRQTKRTRVCVSRKDLTDMLKAFDKACSDPSGKKLVFLELGGERDPILMRGWNLETGQHAVGVVNPIDTGGEWMSEDDWERDLYASGEEEDDDLPAVPVRRKVKKVRIR
jgi:hypothetical protein